MQDFGLVELPYPLRKMSLNPIGTLRKKPGAAGDKERYRFYRGAEVLPSIGASVLLPTDEQLRSIVESGEGRRVKIGTSPLAANAEVRIDPDKLFGRHLAVLGNTGSGKSCSVAGLIRWSMEAAFKAIGDATKVPNMRFVVLDPNGEYARAFADLPDRVRVFKPGDEPNSLTVPAWMWNSHEWGAVTQAQPGAQRPLLMQALRNLRAGRTLREPLHVGVVRQIRLYRSRLLAYIADGTGSSYTDYVGLLGCCQAHKNLSQVMRDFHGRMPAADLASGHLDALANAAQAFLDLHAVWNNQNQRYYYNAPNAAEFNAFLPLFDAIEQAL